MTRNAAKDTSRGKSDFGSRAKVVTFSDTDDFPQFYAKVRCNAAGKLAFTPAGENDDTAAGKIIIDVVAGEIPPWRIRRVWVTGTTVAAGSVHTIEG